jgi:hypothetical protein
MTLLLCQSSVIDTNRNLVYKADMRKIILIFICACLFISSACSLPFLQTSQKDENQSSKGSSSLLSQLQSVFSPNQPPPPRPPLPGGSMKRTPLCWPVNWIKPRNSTMTPTKAMSIMS